MTAISDLIVSRSMGNVRTTGNALNGSAIHRTRRPGQDEIATIYRRMAAVRYQNDTKPDGAGLEKEKRSQDDERMIEPEARRKTKVRNTIVCKADIRREREERTTKRRGLDKATDYWS